MVRIRPERLPPKANKKLHPRHAGPFKILKKISSNTYVLELPAELGISSTFNVEDLILYRGHHTDEGIEEHILSLPPTPPLIKLWMYLMINSYLHAAEVFRSFLFSGRIAQSQMHHGSLLLISSTSTWTYMNVIKLYTRQSRVFLRRGKLVQVEPGPSPMGPTRELSGQSNPTHWNGPQVQWEGPSVL